MKTTIAALLLISTMFSCTNDTSKIEALEKEVLDLHDEVMPHMDQIMTLQSKLKSRVTELDSIQLSGISSNTIAEERMKIADLYKNLALADSLMMEWMYDYNGDSAKSLPNIEAIGYFEIQKKKMQEVQLLTNKSIDETNTFLNQNK